MAAEHQHAYESVNVALGERSYAIHIGDLGLGQSNLLRDLLVPHIGGSQVAIITNDVVGPLYAHVIAEALPDFHVDLYQLPDGEASKTLETYGLLMDFLMQARHNRSTTLIALGGGVVGDLVGFVAATFQRGVSFIQVPTTLLAQVDSSVGGKTAVNHPNGKNMIGAFYQPAAVLADTGVLQSLPQREYAAGLAEVLKYGVIYDAAFFQWLEANADALRERDGTALGYAIRRSCEIKADVVSDDEREQGRRAILNYGHTFGHAIENLSGYGTWLHGEAVAIGMVMAAALSQQVAGLDQAQAHRQTALIQKLGLPVSLSGKSLEQSAFIAAMGMDKKVVDGRMRFILARSLGDVFVADDVPEAELLHLLETFL
ncbi:MAG TPA: 3-dehydroquinate synthase [Gammaproteobacteria bacterium]|jgi:3-dehydroquinate synthase|nr:3-dehydroquinate synthase [Gammaproteobacteria bacterium]